MIWVCSSTIAFPCPFTIHHQLWVELASWTYQILKQPLLVLFIDTDQCLYSQTLVVHWDIMHVDQTIIQIIYEKTLLRTAGYSYQNSELQYWVQFILVGENCKYSEITDHSYHGSSNFSTCGPRMTSLNRSQAT